MSQVSTGKSNRTIITLLAVIAACLVILVILSLDERLDWFKSSGSAKSGYEYSYTAGEFTNSDYAVYDPSTNNEVALGMTRAEAEQALGSPSGDGFIQGLYEYDGDIAVFYREDLVAAIELKDSSRYVTARDIGTNSTIAQVIAAYGEPHVHNGVDPSTQPYKDYLFRRDTFEPVKDANDRGIADIDKIILTFGDSGEKVRVLVTDMEFAKYFR